MVPQEKKLRSVHPDEWGFYDPSQAGIAAVIERLQGRWRRARRNGEPVRTTAPADAQVNNAK
jgi:hypothetical protein